MQHFFPVERTHAANKEDLMLVFVTRKTFDERCIVIKRFCGVILNAQSYVKSTYFPEQVSVFCTLFFFA